ncbi:hypothetical protein GEOBRER4_n3873 [Citrifermentans bremense]|uniref:Flagellar assembly protein FliH n=1 Tax=Citrifermentans bremense TaxID=60035 RepID=A0A7R7FT91_9BACT|nr:FliH/SctL family protein [Citrifermentans bremense]BCO11619.1 hypothetical protein GEOBRER4_n3873 [Citrifermentans bremense]
MSLSNIIKNDGFEVRPWVPGQFGAPVKPVEQGGGFQRIRIGMPDAEEPLVEEEPEPEPEPEPELPMMLEEEALRRIRQAHAEGLKAGKEQAEADLATVSGALAQALLATGSLRAQLLQESEEDLLQLAMLIARKVIQQEISLDPGLLARMVQSALQLASQTGEVVVRLHPEDYAVAIRTGELQRLMEAKGELSIKEDPTIGSGGCIVETARGNIDAGIEAQLEEVSNRLHEERNTRREETAYA